MKLWMRTTLWLAVAAAGCGPSLPPEADTDRAQAALRSTLDAWREGATIESLQERDPAIYVNDPVWRSGRRLDSFELGESGRHGQSWRCEVRLIYRDDGGPSEPAATRYLIDTDPAIVVVRDE